MKDNKPSLYYYQPSVPIAIVGSTAFTIVTAVYLWRFAQRKAWYLWAMYIGLLSRLHPTLQVKTFLTHKQ